MFEINVMSGIRMTCHYPPGMVKRGWGRVVFIRSESALAIPKDMIDYGMTKTAQLAISRGVTVNAVIPGPGEWQKQERQRPVLQLTKWSTIILSMARTSDAKERLMAAAGELTWQQGYNAVTVDAICERAGVKKGSFYYFFKSKAELAIAAMDNAWQTRSRPELDRIFSASNPPLERLKQYFNVLYQKQLEMSQTQGRCLGCPFFSLSMESGGLDPEVWEASRRYLNRKSKYIEAAIRDAQAEGAVEIDSVDEAVEGVWTLLEGALARSRAQGDLDPLRDLYEQSLRLLGVKHPVRET
jgi:TetR/AcrR family transcriptional repressor of nem operon